MQVIFTPEMFVHRQLSDLPSIQDSVLTIGTFDGIHLGHRRLIEAVEREAVRRGAPSVLLTFHPHPRSVLQPGRALPQLNTLEEKIRILNATALQHLVVVPFDAALAELTAEQYISSLLVDRFHPQVLIIGYDHHFGKGRTGNIQLLQDRAERFGYEVIRVEEAVLEGAPVSSTRIREALLQGKPEVAERLLGYPYRFCGNVVQGDALGRTLGYPTANLEEVRGDKLLPADGVYAVTAQADEEVHAGLLSIGVRPTLPDSARKVEVHLLDFSGDLYGKVLEVTLHSYLRGQQKFSGLEELKVQMQADEAEARKRLGR